MIIYLITDNLSTSKNCCDDRSAVTQFSKCEVLDEILQGTSFIFGGWPNRLKTRQDDNLSSRKVDARWDKH